MTVRAVHLQVIQGEVFADAQFMLLEVEEDGTVVRSDRAPIHLQDLDVEVDGRQWLRDVLAEIIEQV